MIHDIHAVIDDIAGMRDELASGHKLVVRTGTEAITHAAVKAGQAGSSFDRGGQSLALSVRYRAHRDNRYNQVEPCGVRLHEYLEVGFLSHPKPIFGQQSLNGFRAPLGLMTLPTAPEN